MRIASLEAIPFRLPRRTPVRFANGEVRAVEHVLVRVRDTDGAVGIAEASPRAMTYGDTARSVVDAFETLIGPRLEGADPRRIEAVHDRLGHLVQNVTARAALDVALWDLKARRAGLPLYQLLGGHTDRVEAAHLLGLDTPERMAEEAAGVAGSLGVRAFKVKVGHAPDEDIARAVAVRAAVGPEATLYLDANHGWDAQAALRVVRALDRRGVDVAWVEEPTPAADVQARRWLVDRVDVPVVADESAPDLAGAAAQLTSGAAQWVSLKTGRTGFSVSRRILGLAAGLGAEVVVGSQVEGRLGVLANLHLAAAFSACARRPAELTSGHGYADDLVEPLAIEDGGARLSEAAGLGVDVDEARLERLRVDR